MKLNEEDLKTYKMFKHFVGQAKIEVEGQAVTTAAHCFSWFDKLGERIEESLKKQPLKVVKER